MERCSQIESDSNVLTVHDAHLNAITRSFSKHFFTLQGPNHTGTFAKHVDVI